MRFAGGGRCERTVLCNNKVSPMNLERLLQCEVDEHGLNWAGYVPRSNPSDQSNLRV